MLYWPILIIPSFLLGFLICKLLSGHHSDGFCFLRKEGSKDQLIFNLSVSPEEILNQKVVTFKVVRLEEDDYYVSESQLQQSLESLLSTTDSTGMD